MEFEWNLQKAASNLAKHTVSFEDAATVFGDPLGRIMADPRHSTEEERFVLLGLSQSKAIRIISARRATRRERRTYEEVTY